MKRILINISNHPSSKWSEKQKEGWDEIIDIPFPNVPPQNDTAQVVNSVLDFVGKEVTPTVLGLQSKYAGEDYDYSFFIAGEQTFTLYLIMSIKNYCGFVNLAIPTTERKVVEKQEGDKTLKESVFEFVRWREIRL